MAVLLVASRTFWEVVPSAEGPQAQELCRLPRRSRALSDSCLDAVSLGTEDTSCPCSDESTRGSISDAEPDSDFEAISIVSEDDTGSNATSTPRWSETECSPSEGASTAAPPGVWAAAQASRPVKVATSRKGTQRLVKTPVDSQILKQALTAPADRTTLVIRDLPEHWDRASLLELLRTEGFLKTCDFVYLPTNFKRARTFGYAIVNFSTSREARRFMDRLSGADFALLRCEWSTSMQGLSALLDRYRNSPVMHPSVPDEHRPLLLTCGSPVVFPEPTQPLKLPEAFDRQPAAKEQAAKPTPKAAARASAKSRR